MQMRDKRSFQKMPSSENIILRAGQAEKKETIKIT